MVATWWIPQHMALFEFFVKHSKAKKTSWISIFPTQMALVSWYPPGQTLIPWRQHMGVVGADSYADIEKYIKYSHALLIYI
jgi:hypothetical protein